MVPSSCVCGLTPTGVAATGVAVSGVMSSAAGAAGAEVENSIDLASEAARVAVTCPCASVVVVPFKVLLTAGSQVVLRRGFVIRGVESLGPSSSGDVATASGGGRW